MMFVVVRVMLMLLVVVVVMKIVVLGFCWKVLIECWWVVGVFEFMRVM